MVNKGLKINGTSKEETIHLYIEFDVKNYKEDPTVFTWSLN